jgi:hypothetical protein
MPSDATPLVLENITYYDQAEVIIVKPQTGPSLPFKDPAIVDQFMALVKQLKGSEKIEEPIQIGDQAYTLAPSLTFDTIRGPIYWEEIVQLESLKQA